MLPVGSESTTPVLDAPRMMIGLLRVPLRLNWRLSILYVPFWNWITSPGLRPSNAVWIVAVEEPAFMVLWGVPAEMGKARVVNEAVLMSVVDP